MNQLKSVCFERKVPLNAVMFSVLKNASPVNAYLFQPPSPPTYRRDSRWPNNVLLTNIGESESVPCLDIGRYARRGPKLLVVYFHGNQADIGQLAPIAAMWARALSARVLVPEYPGYGISAGSPTEESINDVANITIEHALTLASDNEQIKLLIVGRSIGTGPAIRVAAALATTESPLAAVVTVSAYTSVRSIVSSLFGWAASLLLIDRWRSIDIVKNIAVPVCFIHGSLDTLIPPEQSRELYEEALKRNAENELIVVEGGDHVKDMTSWHKQARGFLRKLGLVRESFVQIAATSENED